MTAERTGAALILARMGSLRLHGKAMKEVRGLPMIGYVFDRAGALAASLKIVLATTTEREDDVLAAYASARGIEVFRGANGDVAKRCLDCCGRLGADFFVRLNGDSPWLDPPLIEQGIRVFVDTGADLVTNLQLRTFPYGIAVEVICVNALRAAHDEMTESEKEHVTAFLYRNPSRFHIESLRSPVPELAKARLTIDTPEDLFVFADLVHELGDQATAASFEEVARRYLSRHEHG